MKEPGTELAGLSDTALDGLISALATGSLTPPYQPLTVSRHVPATEAAAASVALMHLESLGFEPVHLLALCRTLAADRRRRLVLDRLVELVATGPAAPGAPMRDTGTVARELFGSARRSVWVVGYAVFGGREVFRRLADQMAEHPDLQVSMCLDVARKPGDTSRAADLVARFGDNFRSRDWPAVRLPAIYYDPRSLDSDRRSRAVLHAKCIVVDRTVAFVSSANFTEAAQNRNIEVGVVVREPSFAQRLDGHFAGLVASGALQPVWPAPL